MELIMQPTSTTCGQACVAMITGKSIEEVIQAMRTDGTPVPLTRFSVMKSI